MSYRVGQQVVCVAEEWEPAFPAGYCWPLYRCVYTIRDIRCTPWEKTAVGFLLEEIHNPAFVKNGQLQESHFDAIGFRPVQKTDISALRALLKTRDEKELIRG
jgi:hypothetical protein